MTHRLLLRGCTPVPLAHYLKALGILRLIAEDKEHGDPEATGHWEGEYFVFGSTLFSGDEEKDRARLSHFFLHDYKPTPIVAPWNGGSGFYYQEEKLKDKDPTTGKRIKTGKRTQATEATRTVDKIAASSAQRFSDYKDAIEAVRTTLTASGHNAAPKEEEKLDIIRLFRNQLPESVVKWMDAAVLLLADGREFPPLLGSGGNDGNLDFTNNFMQRLVEIFDTRTGDAASDATPWLDSALFGNTKPGLLADRAIGQFSPGAAGGPNAGCGFETVSYINPWDYVLMLEGVLLFAAAATKRLESAGAGALAYPFTVRNTGGGWGGASLSDEGDARAEMWLPLWDRPTTLEELMALLREGRVTVGRRPAKDGLDFARAVGGLGVERGIAAFQRYGFLMRSGKAFLATPLGRVLVKRNPQVRLIDELESNEFLPRLRNFARDPKKASGRIQSAVRRLEDSLFNMANRGDPVNVQAVLMQLGAACAAIGTSQKTQKAVSVPPVLSAAWAMQADDGTPEFRIAAALASLADPAMRLQLLPLDPEKPDKWKPSSRLFSWGRGGLVANLIAALRARMLDGSRGKAAGKPFGYGYGAMLDDVAAFLDGRTDEARIERLLMGLVLAEPSPELNSPPGDAALPTAYMAIKPFFMPDRLLRGSLLPDDAHLPLPAEICNWLGADRANDALRLAWRRLRIAGAYVPDFPRAAPTAHGVEGPRLLAALMIPVSRGELTHRFKHLAPIPTGADLIL